MNNTVALSAANNGIVNASGSKDMKQQYDLDQIIGYTGVYTGSRGSLALQSAAWPSGGNAIGQGKNLSGKMMDGTTAKEGLVYHGLRSVDVTRTMQQGASYLYPFDAYPYLQSPSNKSTARSKDTFVLIAAGADRVYGTEDDIASFGDIQP